MKKPASLLALAALAAAPLARAQGITVSAQADSLLILGAVPFIPAVLLLMTGFTRIIIVLSLARQALGLQTTPPNQVLIGLALALTATAMQPVMDRIDEQAFKPWRAGSINAMDAAERATVPLRDFMSKQVRPETLAVFVPPNATPEASLAITTNPPLMTLTGAFALSEMKTAFEISLLVFIPFLLIDLIVSSILMSLGMMMLSPAMVSLPLKLLVFVLADGWALLAGGLVGSFL